MPKQEVQVLSADSRTSSLNRLCFTAVDFQFLSEEALFAGEATAQQPLSSSFFIILLSASVLCSPERANYRLRFPEASEGHPSAPRGP